MGDPEPKIMIGEAIEHRLIARCRQGAWRMNAAPGKGPRPVDLSG
jgi:hypothetical protein